MRERAARKRAVNLFVDAELLDEARRLHINISDTLERRLATIVRAEQEKRWLEENRKAIESINSFIDRHGILAGKLRHRPDN
ncbi:MAG TPA: type II toxin-antitoxin system CcdA family antitoxin [Xanthobacteraceae bacterium]